MPATNATLLPARMEQALAAARRAADAAGVAVCVALVDQAGTLCAFLRMPGAFLISDDLAVDKAWSAAGMALSTRALGEMLAGQTPAVRDGLLRRPRLTQVPGGLPIMRAGRCAGGVGISGGSQHQDEDIARAALAALEEV
ncbi:MAG: GlcG/HbpS family heme-binding protein [Sphingopyxis sp.]